MFLVNGAVLLCLETGWLQWEEDQLVPPSHHLSMPTPPTPSPG